MYNSQEIADKIKTTASANGAKLGDMFSELGISPNTLHNMKTSMPKTDTLAKIADYLDVSVDYLLGREQKNNAPNDVRSAIIARVKALPDDRLDRLLGYLEALAAE